ncbi:MAG: protein-export chaperone SecB [Gammaproteobacteria bacterium]|nr:protein-export chaperone SecB [Gammaproteobacteria bacterium]
MTEEQQTTQNLNIEQIYVKDISLETPGLPEAFKQKEQSELFVDLNVHDTPLGDHFYEVVLSATITAKEGEKVIFLVELEQAGIFSAEGFNEAQLSHLLGAYCPSVLFPYAREMIANLIMHAGLPQLNLAPVNFDALYRQQLQQQEKSK